MFVVKSAVEINVNEAIARFLTPTPQTPQTPPPPLFILGLADATLIQHR